MLSIVQIEEIEHLLLLLPDLVQKQEQRAADFVPGVGAWLSALEKALTANRLYQAGNVAILRSGLVAAQQGQVPVGFEFRSRPTHGKILTAVAAQALQRAADLASALVAENRPRLTEAERVAQQIVAVAMSRELVILRTAEISNIQYLTLFRRSLAASSDLENAVVHLESLVGRYDALILFDHALGLTFNGIVSAD